MNQANENTHTNQQTNTQTQEEQKQNSETDNIINAIQFMYFTKSMMQRDNTSAYV